MNIIIAGAGEVGYHLAKMLSFESHMITVIDGSEARLNQIANNADVVPIAGSPTSIRTLEKAGVTKCDLFIAVSPSEAQEVNIVSALLAKRLGAKRVTARINDNEYLQNENRIIFTDFGIDMLIYPEKLAAHEILDLLRQTGTSEFMDFTGGRLQLIVIKLMEGSPIVNKTVGEVTVADGMGALPYRAVAIARDGNTIIPRDDTTFKLQDTVFILTRRETAQNAMSLGGKGHGRIKSVMIMGGGRIGHMVAHTMETRIEKVRVIERDEARCQELTESLSRSLIIHGDARNTDLLLEEDLMHTDAFVAVTSSAEANILSCMAAKRVGVKMTIAKVENLDYIKLAESVGVDATINKKVITANRIYRNILGSNDVSVMKYLNGTDAEVMEFITKPGSQATLKKVGDLRLPDEAIIGGLTRGNNSIIVHADTQIMEYDRVVVVALPSALKTVAKFFI